MALICPVAAQLALPLSPEPPGERTAFLLLAASLLGYLRLKHGKVLLPKRFHELLSLKGWSAAIRRKLWTVFSFFTGSQTDLEGTSRLLTPGRNYDEISTSDSSDLNRTSERSSSLLDEDEEEDDDQLEEFLRYRTPSPLQTFVENVLQSWTIISETDAIAKPGSPASSNDIEVESLH